MSSTEKFTVCIATYNQMDYIETMLQSVFEQDYKDLEVIIVDDCSPDFDQAKLEKIIQKHNRRNIPYEIIHNKKNVGIVKGLNSAISIAKGAYIYFVAGDDKLQDSAVVSHFVRAFHAQPKSNIITSEYLLYDTALSQIVDASSDPMGGVLI